eukprot:scaffold3778_cov177-Chaetoceros_neogracile.AAC.1
MGELKLSDGLALSKVVILADGTMVGGTLLIDGRPVELVDGLIVIELLSKLVLVGTVVAGTLLIDGRPVELDDGFIVSIFLPSNAVGKLLVETDGRPVELDDGLIVSIILPSNAVGTLLVEIDGRPVMRGLVLSDGLALSEDGVILADGTVVAGMLLIDGRPVELVDGILVSIFMTSNAVGTLLVEIDGRPVELDDGFIVSIILPSNAVGTLLVERDGRPVMRGLVLSDGLALSEDGVILADGTVVAGTLLIDGRPEELDDGKLVSIFLTSGDAVGTLLVKIDGRPVTRGLVLSDGFALSEDGVILANGTVVGGTLLMEGRPVELDDGILVSIFLTSIAVGTLLVEIDGRPVMRGLVLSDGLALSEEGFILRDGTVVTAMLLIDGRPEELDDGILETVLLSSNLLGTLLGEMFRIFEGVILADGTVVTVGLVETEGKLLIDGITVIVGTLLKLGRPVMDGLMLSDGLALSEGVILTDGTVVTVGLVEMEGKLLIDGITVIVGTLLKDGRPVMDGL